MRKLVFNFFLVLLRRFYICGRVWGVWGNVGLGAQMAERIILTEEERKFIENKRNKDSKYQAELQEKAERKKKWNELVTSLSDLLKDSSPTDAEKIFQEAMRKREDYLSLIAERQRSDRAGEEELEMHYRKRFDPNFVRDSDPTRYTRVRLKFSPHRKNPYGKR